MTPFFFQLRKIFSQIKCLYKVIQLLSERIRNSSLSDYKACGMYYHTTVFKTPKIYIVCTLFHSSNVNCFCILFSLSLVWPGLPNTVLIIERQESWIKGEICDHGMKTNSNNKTKNKQTKHLSKPNHKWNPSILYAKQLSQWVLCFYWRFSSIANILSKCICN